MDSILDYLNQYEKVIKTKEELFSQDEFKDIENKWTKAVELGWRWDYQVGMWYRDELSLLRK